MSEPEKLDLRQYIEEQFNDLKSDIQDMRTKLDYVLHPKNGIFAELQRVNSKVDAAHRRIDGIEGRRDRRRKNIDRIVVALIGTGIGVLITIAINKIIEGVF